MPVCCPRSLILLRNSDRSRSVLTRSLCYVKAVRHKSGNDFGPLANFCVISLETVKCMLQFHLLLMFEIFSPINARLFENRLMVSLVYNEVTSDIFQFLRKLSKFVCKGC